MFHEITDAELACHRKRCIIAACIITLIAIAVCFIVSTAQANAREQSAVALHASIMGAAKQCCAIEGSYPASLEHLEKNYGLTIDHNSYLISYESFADNIMPTVVVVPR